MVMEDKISEVQFEFEIYRQITASNTVDTV